jgi:hypothetical protein
VTRETAASSAGPGHDRPDRARACLLAGEAGAAAAADYAHDRPRPDETSRVIDRADRPHAPAAGSGPAGSPGPAHARDTAGPAPWLPLRQAPEGGADVTGLVRMTSWTRTRHRHQHRHRRRYAGAGRAIGASGGRWRVRRPGGGPCE